VNQGDALHALAWLGWLTACMVVLIVTRNPIYLVLTLLWISVVSGIVTMAGMHVTTVAPPFSVWRVGLFVIPFAAMFNALFVHVGTTVLFTLPATWPIVGGPITAEALVYGALNGLALIGLLAAFTVFNRVVPVRGLIQLIPRAYFSVAVTVAISVTFVPSTLRQAEQIREAQAIRGRALTGVRGWLPLFLSLLSNGLERALQLAEAMVARGFASSARSVYDWRTQLMLVAGLSVFLAGWLLRLMAGMPLIGGLLVICGLLLFVAAVWIGGRRHPHTTYRPAPWRGQDWLVTGAAGITAAIFLLPLPGIDRSTLAYSPYPTLSLPGFSLALGMATWGLLGPALVVLKSRGDD
jgi:energy-coupling factor transport system permease protein